MPESRKPILHPVMQLVVECYDHTGPSCTRCGGKGWNYLFNRTDGTVLEGRRTWIRPKPEPVQLVKAGAIRSSEESESLAPVVVERGLYTLSDLLADS